MPVGVDKRWSRPVVGMVVAAAFVVAIAPSSVVAQDEPDSVVFVERGPATCPAETTSAFIRELRLRTTAELVPAANEDRDTGTRALRLNAVNETSCEVRFEEAEITRALILKRDADQIEIASTASRLAWIIDGSEASGSGEDTGVADEESRQLGRKLAFAEEVAGATGDRAVGMASGLSRPPTPDDSGEIGLSAQADGGVVWVPSTRSTVPVSNVGVGWQPGAVASVDLRGRLPMSAVRFEHEDIEASYRPWAFELTGGVRGKIGDDWSVAVDGGVGWTNYALSSFRDNGGGPSSDMPEQNPGQADPERETTVPDSITSWMVVTRLAARYSVMRMLSVGLDAGVMMSPTDRTITDDQQVVVDLGHVEVEMLLGLELRL